MSTIPFTRTSPGWTSTRPRPFTPIRLHPGFDHVQTPPPLPCPPRPTVFHTTTSAIYKLSTHLIPAAYPRLTLDVPLPEIPAYDPGRSPTDRREMMDELVNRVLGDQAAYDEDRLTGSQCEKPLWNCLNRYVRTPTSSMSLPGITLFLAHANGFHKETWETMLKNLLDAPAGAMVDEVWAWEAVQHGDAAVLNASHLTGMFEWFDNSLDIANFLLHYLPEDVDETVLPTHLPRLSALVTDSRRERGYRTRRLVVVGHSFGGCTSVRVAFDFPKLFSSVVLVDPVIHRPGTQRRDATHRYVLGAFTRRDRWSSREEALQLFQKSPFFAAWNPDVLQLYVDHALVDDAEGGVRLKMPGLQEGISFANKRLPMETWELLERLDAGVTLRWIVPDDSLSTWSLTEERVWRRPADSTNVVFNFAGHLIVQEAPVELAHDISDFLLCKYGTVGPHL